MLKSKMIRHIREVFVGKAYQSLALSICVLFGLAMIVNTQLEGEAMWFWYTTLFRGGLKLYSDLHLALQPLFILEMSGWIKLFGSKCLVTEIPSVIHLLVLCSGIFLVLRESDWPDWQKAILLIGAFVLSVGGTTYRFDDYHVTAETFILYSLVLLLMLAKADAARRQFILAAALGVLSGFTITTRINDGAALLVVSGLSLLALARKRKLIVLGLFVVIAALTVVLVVRCTGDSFSDYVSNSITRAAGSKGGTSSFLADPFLLFSNTLQLSRGAKWLFLEVLAVFAAGGLVQFFWKNEDKYIVAVQLGVAGVAFAFSSQLHRHEIVTGAFVQYSVMFVIVINYLLAPVVVARYVMWKMRFGKREWDAREILVLLPLAEWASVSASSGGRPQTQLYAPVAMLLLLVPVILPFRKQVAWAHASFVTILALLALAGVIVKIQTPYSFQNYGSSSMFVNRQWYRHPVYGPMYIDRDLLQFSSSVCADIEQGNSRPELLSLPLPYPNYFCAIPPWHGYVQTFFDTSLRSTIDRLMRELDTAPPQWIIYRRQMRILGLYEIAFNHGQRLAQRDLDEMIVQKVATRQWQVVDEKKYGEDSWYVIRTRP